MKVIARIESIPGNLNQRFIVEIVDDDKVISRGQDHFADKGDEMADAARKAVSNLRCLADSAERALIQMGILKK
jgi:hypothetical protein